MQTHTLRVLSYNIQGHGSLFSRRYLERIARVIIEARPDVVGLQEVHRRTWQSRFEDQAEALGRLTGLNVSFGPSFPLRGGEFGNAVLTAGEVLGAEVVPLPGAGEPRSLLHSKVVLPGFGDKARERALDFYVTHLAAWGRWQSTARGMQVSGILERLRQCEGPFVLVGDLNAAPGSPELGPMMAAEIFRSCEGLVCTHRFLRRQIDYVFADPGWATTASRVLRIGPSDHWPVLVELRRDPQA